MCKRRVTGIENWQNTKGGIGNSLATCNLNLIKRIMPLWFCCKMKSASVRFSFQITVVILIHLFGIDRLYLCVMVSFHTIMPYHPIIGYCDTNNPQNLYSSDWHKVKQMRVNTITITAIVMSKQPCHTTKCPVFNPHTRSYTHPQVGSLNGIWSLHCGVYVCHQKSASYSGKNCVNR